MSLPIRIIGIGSPHGADRAGWLVAERLSHLQELEPSLSVLANPWDLLDQLEECESLLMIDACITGAEVGSVIRLSWPDRRIAAHRSLSSHGLGLGETLQLAEQLGRLPKSTVLYCLEVTDVQPDPSGSDAPIPGLDELERGVLAEVRQWKLDQPDLRELNNDA